MAIQIAPSILAGDFAHLAQQARKMEQAGAALLHLDVMDGHFVPNITIGAPVIQAIRPHTNMLFDVHLMISQPERYLDDFAKAGADIITVHAEVDADIPVLLQEIRTRQCKAAVSVKPGTPVETLFPYLAQLDMVLIMTVEPGFGGQAFQDAMLPKIRAVKEEIDRQKLQVDIEVDGGINLKTIPLAAAAGANIFVAGNAVFGAPDPAQAVAQLRTAAENAQ